MQHSKVRKGICAANLNIITAPHRKPLHKGLASFLLLGECVVGSTTFIIAISTNGGKGLKIKTYLL